MSRQGNRCARMFAWAAVCLSLFAARAGHAQSEPRWRWVPTVAANVRLDADATAVHPCAPVAEESETVAVLIGGYRGNDLGSGVEVHAEPVVPPH